MLYGVAAESPGGATEYRQGHRPCESKGNKSPGGATEYPVNLLVFLQGRGLCWIIGAHHQTIGAHHRLLSPLRGYIVGDAFTGAMPLPIFCRPFGAYTFITIVLSNF